MEYVISNKTSLDKLENDKSLKRTIRRIKIDMGSNENFSKLEKQLNRHYFACGCETGTFAVLITFLVGCIIWLTDAAPIIWVWWKVLSILFLSSLFGKIIGLGISHMKLRRLLRELKVKMKWGS